MRNLGGRSRRRESGVVDPLLLPDQEDDVRSSTTPSSSQMSASPTYMALTGGQDPGALGLNVVYTPDNGHKADIVFIHGLGGSSRMTWSKHKSPGLFWPLTFLPLEPDICLARILSFGYDADFTNGSNATNVILDFAKTLLYNLKYYTDVQGENLNMGQVRPPFYTTLLLLKRILGTFTLRSSQHGWAHRERGNTIHRSARTWLTFYRPICKVKTIQSTRTLSKPFQQSSSSPPHIGAPIWPMCSTEYYSRLL